MTAGRHHEIGLDSRGVLSLSQPCHKDPEAVTYRKDRHLPLVDWLNDSLHEAAQILTSNEPCLVRLWSQGTFLANQNTRLSLNLNFQSLINCQLLPVEVSVKITEIQTLNGISPELSKAPKNEELWDWARGVRIFRRAKKKHIWLRVHGIPFQHLSCEKFAKEGLMSLGAQIIRGDEGIRIVAVEINSVVKEPIRCVVWGRSEGCASLWIFFFRNPRKPKTRWQQCNIVMCSGWRLLKPRSQSLMYFR